MVKVLPTQSDTLNIDNSVLTIYTAQYYPDFQGNLFEILTLIRHIAFYKSFVVIKKVT